ncbi:Metallo-dependent phosphatase-like protein [Mycena maculata]|uniref:Purple acid phosphatase n=1 Tax=Mycena maculata TaxID=230809 RepID=A0AAD7P2Q0_9AGAR|nr:Metallo-dependent phosphatase-like protein [Mycena maculata]
MPAEWFSTRVCDEVRWALGLHVLPHSRGRSIHPLFCNDIPLWIPRLCGPRSFRLCPNRTPAIPADLTTPVQQRLAFNGPTSMRIGWSTFQQLERPTVYFGQFIHAMFRSASSQSSTTYPTSRTWSNTVTMTMLEPYTTYCASLAAADERSEPEVRGLDYKIVSTNSTIGSFKTARAAGNHTPFTMAGVIDMGVFGPDGLSTRQMSYTGKAIVNSLNPADHTTIQALVATASQFEFILHPGDFACTRTRGSQSSTLATSTALKRRDHRSRKVSSSSSSINLPPSRACTLFSPRAYASRLISLCTSRYPGSKAYMVTAGNHESNCLNGKSPGEASCPIGRTNFTGFINRYAELMPETRSTILGPRPRFDTGLEGARMKARAAATSTSGALSPFWYSFDYGMTHYLMFDTETDFGNGIIAQDEAGGGADSDGPFGSYTNQQVDFIERDLASVDRAVTPWVVAAGHRPWYVDSGACATCQAAFEPLLLKHAVDVAYFGHVHNMQLLGPLANNTRDPRGYDNPSAPVYLLNGAAGHFESLDLMTTPDQLPRYGIEWANNGTLYGYNLFKFLDRSRLEIQFVSSKDGAVLNSVTLFKKH